ncbi:hypothetical protein NA57DRAFT_23428, partial [Rhizodiscina lignyota]
MDSTSSALASALFQWINTFALPSRVESWRDLEDGQILWLVLQNIDPGYFQGSLPGTDRKSTDNWIPRWQNLKHIDRMATTYIRDECGQLQYLSRNMNPDLKAIAIDGSPEQSLKLLQSVLLAAMYSPVSNQRMVKIMQGLGGKVGAPIMNAIQEAEALDARLEEYGTSQDDSNDIDTSGESDSAPRGASFDRDPELEREEKLIQAMQKNKELDDQVTLLTEDKKEGEETIAKLKQRLAATEDELERRQQHGISDQDLDDYRSKSQSERDYIAELESDLQFNKSKVEEQDRQIERLKEDATTKQQLRDELQLAKAECDELASKAKATENLKKKIQVLQDDAKSAASLRSQLQAANEKLEELEPLRDENIMLRKANEESAKAIANGEQAVFDQKTARQHKEHEYNVLLQKYDQQKDMNARLMETIREQEEHIRDSGNQGGDGERLESLDDELEATEKSQQVLSKATTKAAATDAVLLQQKLDAQSYRVHDLEEKYLNVYQENLGLNDVITTGAGSDQLEETSYFVRQRDQLQATSKELEGTKSKYIASTSELADLKHRLAAAETGDSNANVEALKFNKERQEHTEKLELDNQELRDLVWHALKRDNANVPDDIRESNEYKLIREQLVVLHAASSADAPQTIDHTAARLADRAIKAGKELQDTTKRAEEHVAQIQSLQRELEMAKKVGGDGALVCVTADELVNLRRENKLLTSAWYDLTSRLQSNTVVLQRRSEPPKSWLGRQRLAVGQG